MAFASSSAQGKVAGVLAEGLHISCMPWQGQEMAGRRTWTACAFHKAKQSKSHVESQSFKEARKMNKTTPHRVPGKHSCEGCTAVLEMLLNSAGKLCGQRFQLCM